MKILIVRTFPDIINPEKYNVQEIGLAKALTRAGHECGIVLYYGKNKDFVERIPVTYQNEKKEIVIYRLHGFNILKNGIFPSLRKIAEDYDVIQIHEYDQITSWLWYAWSKRPIIIYHGPYFHPFNKGYNLKCKVFDNIFLRLKHNKNIVCLTKSHAAELFLKERGFIDVTAIGVGLDADNFAQNRTMDEFEINVPQDKFNLLYVGKIEKRRNPYFLLEVLETVCNQQDNINCIIVGNGEADYTEQFLQKAENLMQKGKLQYYPSASQSQLVEVYRNTQLMVFPTHYDIFGMVLLEALYFGLPVISTPNGGADMLISDNENGWILECDNVEEWSQLIEKIYLDRALYKKVTETIRYESNRGLYWDELIEEFEKAYLKAIKL